MPNWTAEQQRAISANGNLLVSAGAGSGKTAVLTARIVRLIRGGESINSILCVTFTNAAAAEMKKRIEKSLANAAAETEGEEAEKLYRASRGASAANISTLHAFCTQVLRRHFNLVGLDPAFRVADAGETAILRQNAYDELVEDCYASGGSRFNLLMEGLGGDESAEEDIYAVYDFARSQIDPNAWLDAALTQYDINSRDELLRSDAAAGLVKKSISKIANRCDVLQAARDEMMQYGAEKPAAFIDGELLTARSLLLCTNAAELAAALETFAFGKGRINWDGLSDHLRTAADKARKDMKREIAEAQEFWCGNDYIETIRLHRPLIEELCGFIKELDERYAQKKLEAGCIDYGDMEHKCLAVLKNSEAREEYSRRFTHVFMDEYQDCNPVQESILNSIANGGSTFLVGDVKQSIYRFRLAEPALFMRRYADYQQNEGGELICLNHNFRSACGVINAVNSLFSAIMHSEAGEIEYDDEAALKFGRNDGEEDETRAEFLLLDMMDAQEEDGEMETDAAAAEAAAAARRIHELMETERVRDAATGGERPLKYSDFAVLLRSYKRSAETWMRTLAANGIPAYALLSDGYFDAIEVRVFMDLLRIIDNRRQDIPLAAVLRSPIGGFDERELIALKTDFPAPTEHEDDWAWIDRIHAAAAAGGELGQKAKRFADRLEHYRREAKLLSAEALIGMLLDETGYGEYCAAMPGGRQRQANLEALCERARACAAAGVRSLGGFLSYMEKVHTANAYGAPQTGGANVVSIMSIHASKGLEFPYVIIGGLNSQFVRDDKANLICEKELGIGARLISGEIKQQSFMYDAVTAALSAKATAEEMRVLYVAMTRARERLIMLCAAKDGARLVNQALAPQTQSSIMVQRSFASWILGHILRSKDGNGIREKYGFAPVFGDGVYIQARCIPAPLAAYGGGEMDEDGYNAFVKDALKHADNAESRKFFMRTYAHAQDVGLPGKLSVTGLSGTEHTELNDAPRFARENSVAPVQLGTAVHEIMRRLPLDKPITEQSVAELAKALVKAGIMDEAAAGIVPVRSVAAFFGGELGQRLLRAETVRRETEFNLRIGARELLGADTDEAVLLQGVIDCCFIENGEWVLIDYKTDRVDKNYSAHDAAKRHFAQLGLYKKALERLTGRRVAHSYIYLFSIGEAIEYSEDF